MTAPVPQAESRRAEIVLSTDVMMIRQSGPQPSSHDLEVVRILLHFFRRNGGRRAGTDDQVYWQRAWPQSFFLTASEHNRGNAVSRSVRDEQCADPLWAIKFVRRQRQKIDWQSIEIDIKFGD